MAIKLKLNSTDIPRGEFTFCAILGQGIENDDGGFDYKATLRVDEKEARSFMDLVDDFAEDNMPKNADLVKVPYQTHDDWDGIPQGMVQIDAKTSTTFYDKKKDEEVQQVVKIFDKDGDLCTLGDGIAVGSGTTGKPLGVLTFWERTKRRNTECGVTFYLSGVQIADLVPYKFDEKPEKMEGSFKGFDKKSALEKEEEEVGEEGEKPTRRPRRRRR